MRTMHMLHELEAEVGKSAVTVRLGSKWADSLASDLELCVCRPEPDMFNPEFPVNHTIEGHGVVEYIWTGKFLDVPARLIRFEHEISSRCYDGLYHSMKRAYGDNFHASSEVTVVCYRRID